MRNGELFYKICGIVYVMLCSMLIVAYPLILDMSLVNLILYVPYTIGIVLSNIPVSGLAVKLFL